MHAFHDEIAAGHESQVTVGLVGAGVFLFDVEAQATTPGSASASLRSLSKRADNSSATLDGAVSGGAERASRRTRRCIGPGLRRAGALRAPVTSTGARNGFSKNSKFASFVMLVARLIGRLTKGDERLARNLPRFPSGRNPVQSLHATWSPSRRPSVHRRAD